MCATAASRGRWQKFGEHSLISNGTPEIATNVLSQNYHNMTVNEILLMVVFIALLIIPSWLLKRIKQPLNTYIKLASGLLLLILIWFFADKGSLSLKGLMTIVVVSSMIKTIKDYVDFSRHIKKGAQ
jgi:hypothetical protein